jgi:hypothetical protein
MGSTLAIINGSVDIDVNATMSQAYVQTVVDQMLKIRGHGTPCFQLNKSS